MNIEEKSFRILVVGRGKEFFDEHMQEHTQELKDNDLYLGIDEGFSAPEITNIMVTIGAGVITGVSTYYITKLIDSIFSAKNKAKDSGVKMNINITINQGNQYIQIGSDQEQVKKEILSKRTELNEQ
ncbi:hypothetical protein [Cellvibrio japonicus]|uniref:hypothetical protein n=1 Tax=Cellvibrio japonicus TaxID=155077 RepID=UPI000674BCBF|nr:hypothetical protein [Cellvibrio japonicus]QEI11464.1 hypothetical protein FY117_03945 [Cellvibrio japonicus]QEI15038.1 hypothetical protein FY116_03945 [Cellvibrio japonicus]QEI18618.1 hypothetical protein FY115_03945 [Cellvibrio japonicus]